MSKLFLEIHKLPTEQCNETTQHIDTASTRQILEYINDEDAKIAAAVQAEIPQIELAVNAIVGCFNRGGRLIYAGAGTSGRLGVLDASECPPTFGVTSEMVQAVIAGGEQAVFRAQEGAEDLLENGTQAIAECMVENRDIVCGIAASGRTPFVLGALEEARRRGAFTIIVSTNSPDNLLALGIRANVMICPNVGPEVIAGSTRMKSGTAQKLVLNMLTTASMIRLGKTYGNIMVDLQLTNAKLRERAKGIIMSLGGVEQYDEAERLLELASGRVKTALVMALGCVNADTADSILKETNGFVRNAVDLLKQRDKHAIIHP